ncbi:MULTISPECIES: peptidylprolyl isomerase [Giesbergeria]|uniref:Chaperone SurA n=1 Tax=Giesbergeria sinuosa TaxID=80883 RepID=A0ABV9QEB5_9BURK
MNHRVFALGLACLATFATSGASAQGLRPAATGSHTPSLSRALSAPVLLPAPGSSPTTRQADYIVAVVNSEPVTHNEVQARVARVAQQLAGQPNPPPLAVVEREVLERLILEKIQLQQAQQNGIRVDDVAVAQAEQMVASQNSVSREEMYRRLAADGVTPERFRQDLRRQLLQQRLREREVDARVRISDLEADAYLREQTGGQSAASSEINLGHVLITVPEDASPEAVAQLQARAQQVVDQARAGGDFAALARSYSESPERAQGGLMGLRPADRYPELFTTAVQTLPVGGVVGPLRSAAGFHVLKLVDKVSTSKLPPITQNRARHILLRATPQLSEAAAVERLADYRRRVLAGQADFADLAREHSQDGSAKQGGDLGWSTPGRYVPEFESVLEALQPSEISQPLVSRFGVHLIQLMERRQVQPSPREQREMARYALREKKIEEAYNLWAQELRARAYVEYRDAP